jgi:hypothetical protein
MKRATVVRKEIDKNGKVKTFSTLMKGVVLGETTHGVFVADLREQRGSRYPQGEWFSTSRDSLTYAVVTV